jgi:hypothetical protein
MNEEYRAVLFEVIVSSGIDPRSVSVNADRKDFVSEHRLMSVVDDKVEA